MRRIKQFGICLLPERRYAALRIARVTLLQINQKVREISRESFFDQLLIPSFGARFRTCRQEDLERSFGEDHRADVTPVADQARQRIEGPLTEQQSLANRRQGSHFRGTGRHFLGADCVADQDTVETNVATGKLNIENRRQSGNTGFVAPIDSGLFAKTDRSRFLVV